MMMIGAMLPFMAFKAQPTAKTTVDAEKMDSLPTPTKVDTFQRSTPAQRSGAFTIDFVKDGASPSIIRYLKKILITDILTDTEKTTSVYPTRFRKIMTKLGKFSEDELRLRQIDLSDAYREELIALMPDKKLEIDALFDRLRKKSSWLKRLNDDQVRRLADRELLAQQYMGIVDHELDQAQENDPLIPKDFSRLVVLSGSKDLNVKSSLIIDSIRFDAFAEKPKAKLTATERKWSNLVDETAKLVWQRLTKEAQNA